MKQLSVALAGKGGDAQRNRKKRKQVIDRPALKEEITPLNLIIQELNQHMAEIQGKRVASDIGKKTVLLRGQQQERRRCYERGNRQSNCKQEAAAPAYSYVNTALGMADQAEKVRERQKLYREEMIDRGKYSTA